MKSIKKSELFAIAWRIARNQAKKENCTARECFAWALVHAWEIVRESEKGKMHIHDVIYNRESGTFAVSYCNILTCRSYTRYYNECKNKPVPKSVITWCLGSMARCIKKASAAIYENIALIDPLLCS